MVYLLFAFDKPVEIHLKLITHRPRKVRTHVQPLPKKAAPARFIRRYR